MAHEYPKAEYYDSATNHDFREALINHLLAPAFAKAYFEEAHDDNDSYIVLDEEIQYDGCRMKYDLQAASSGDLLTITSCTLTRIEDVSTEAGELLHGLIQNSSLDPEFKFDFWGQPEKIQRDATVETYAKYLFTVRLYDKSITVASEIGVAVNGREVMSNTEDSLNETELDENRSTYFEIEEFVEIVRALLALDLVTTDDVKVFLNAF